MLIERLSKDYDRIAKVGEIACAQAWAAGVAVYYTDDKIAPNCIIKHYPDGRLEVLDLDSAYSRK